MGIKLKSPAGGSVELIADPTLATDEQLIIDETGNYGIENGGDIATGWYTKFPDGTLICTYLHGTPSVCSIDSGGSFFSPELTFAFAHAFVGIPMVTFVAQYPSGSSYPWGKAGTTLSSTQASGYLHGTSITAEGQMGFTAIGRWK